MPPTIFTGRKTQKPPPARARELTLECSLLQSVASALLPKHRYRRVAEVLGPARRCALPISAPGVPGMRR